MNLYDLNYTTVGDITAVCVCLVNWLLLASSYNTKRKSLRIFNYANANIIVATVVSVVFHSLLRLHAKGELTYDLVILMIVCRAIMYILLIMVFNLYVVYLCDLLGYEWKEHKVVRVIYTVMVCVMVLAIVLEQPLHYGFYVDAQLVVHESYTTEVFRYFYVVYIAILAFILISGRNKFITKMYACLLSVVAVSFLVMFAQNFVEDTSFTIFAFTLPIMAVVYLFHYNAYDQETGTLDYKAFNGYIKDLNGTEFSIIHLYLRDLDLRKKIGISEDFYHFNEQFFKNPITFRMREDKLLMVYKNEENREAGTKIVQLLNEFNKLYVKYKMDYRIVLLHSYDKIVTGADYMELIEFVESKMDINSVRQCSNEDVQEFLMAKQIVDELADINRNEDLDDPRVKVFCQPVLNTEKGIFNTAESLMRLELPGLGMVFPDVFIPLAEQNDYIHALSRIILNKTCKELRRLQDEGYDVERISVNFSILELKDEKFCEDILRIIEQNRIPYSSIAMELTESRSEQDFEMVKKTMLKLHRFGIRFYLDDFGTGYSNFERIIGLPIDIIKFDRSLTILSSKDDSSEYMVGSFSNIFKKANYQVLFEGVEDDTDEERCMGMQAMYLQGYKYSKPIPIEQLKNFMVRKSIEA